MRRGETCGVRWSDIDLPARTVTVTQQITSVDGRAIFDEPKTERGRRTISLDAETVDVLRDHASRQAAAVIEAGSLWQETGLVFTREDGSFVHPKRLSHVFEKLCRHARLPHIGIHGMRHTYATIALRAAVPRLWERAKPFVLETMRSPGALGRPRCCGAGSTTVSCTRSTTSGSWRPWCWTVTTS